MAQKKSKLKKELLSQLPPPGPMANRISSSTSSLQNSSSVLVRTYVDEKMSLEQLMEMGSRSGQSRYEKAPRPTQKLNQLPLSFNQPQVLNRQRGSSAGHSPQGSSDDNFSHSRNTLSPGGMDGLAYGTAPSMMPRHHKQASAPELNHHQYDVNAFSPAHSAIHQHTTSLHAPSSRPVQIPQIPQQMPYGSKSVSAIDQQFGLDGPVAPPMQPHHNRSTSYDVTHAAHFNAAQGFGGYQSEFFALWLSQQAHSHQELYGLGMHQQQQPQQHQPMQQTKEKSQSMDPIIINSVQQQQQPQPMQQPQFETPSEIGLSLPPNWSIGHTEHGEIFFIDHSNQTTTWYDPRIPQHLQEERIRVQHGMAAAADPNAAAAHQQVQQQQAQQQAAAAAQQHAAQQQQHHFAMGQVAQQPPQPHQMLEQSNARIQSLDSEVNAMHERQRELMQQGLYGSPQPMQYDHNVNNNLSSVSGEIWCMLTHTD
ncbi:yap-1 [Pristionchus pacificus]|uniref:Yap-1 n=1 Tax=Pristionchus pacificus TaxID=54126 RepID=A0A2A6B4X7_PRIPA|nr:yap-1 [Pristionchus pacificus]|eukprot:PDM60945.1 yap-1 [Pristionchus pacificus]